MRSGSHQLSVLVIKQILLLDKFYSAAILFPFIFPFETSMFGIFDKLRFPLPDYRLSHLFPFRPFTILPLCPFLSLCLYNLSSLSEIWDGWARLDQPDSVIILYHSVFPRNLSFLLSTTSCLWVPDTIISSPYFSPIQPAHSLLSFRRSN